MSKIKSDKVLLILIFSGLVLRLVLATLPGFKIDVDDWFYWAMRLKEVGLSKFYSPDIFTDYLPGYLYILYFLSFIKEFFSLDSPVFYYLLKIPSIISEIILGIFLYLSLLSRSKKSAQLAAASILLNPALIFNSSVWGQVDGVLSLAMFASVYFLNQKKLIVSSILIALAFLVKPQAIAIFPIFGFYFIKHFSLDKIIKLILPAMWTIILLSIPFFSYDPLGGLFNRVIETANQYQYNSLFAFNLWGNMGFWIPDTNLIGPLSLQIISLLLFSIFWIFLTWIYFHKNLNLMAMSALACLAFFFLPTKVHERYLYPALIFLIYIMHYYKLKWLYICGYSLIIIHTFNLYYVFMYYNQIYFNTPQLLYLSPLYELLDTKAKLLSLISSIIFLTIAYKLTRHELQKTTTT